MARTGHIVAASLGAALIASAAGAAPPPVVDLSGGWSAAEAREAAAALAQRCLAHTWHRTRRAHGLVIAVAPATNRSSEMIDTRELERELGAQLQQAATAAGVRGLKALPPGAPGSKRAAFRATLSLRSQNDAVPGRELRHTFVILAITDAATGELPWIGVHQLIKLIERAPAVDDRHRPRPPAPRQPAVKITRLKPDAKVDLSGYFNGADANLFARRAAASLRQAMARRGRPLLVRAYPVKNRSSMHVETLALIALFQEQTLGAVRWLADAAEPDAPPPRRGREPEAILSGWFATAPAGPGQQIALTLTLLSAADQRTIWSDVQRGTKVLVRR